MDKTNLELCICKWEEARSIRNEQRERALELLKEAIDLVAPYNDSFYTYRCINLCFSIYYSYGENWSEKANAFAHEMLLKYPEYSYPFVYMELRQMLAQTQRYIGNKEVSIKMAEECRALFKKHGNNGYGYGQLLIGLCYNYTLLNDFEAAYNSINEAEVIAKRLDNVELMTKVLYYQSNLDSKLSDNSEACLKLIRCLKLLKQEMNETMFSAALSDLSITLKHAGKPLYAAYFGERALQICIANETYAITNMLADRLFNHYLDNGQTSELRRVHEQFGHSLKKWKSEQYEKLYKRQELVLALIEKNQAVAAATAKELEEYLPHFFVQYEKERTLIALADFYFETGNYKQAALHLKTHARLLQENKTEEQTSRIRSHQVRQRLNTIQQEKQKAENLAKMKQEFLANMSHEIRSPMHAVIGMSDLLLKDELSNRQQEKVQVISRSAHHLLHVINDVLDSSKIDAGKIEIENMAFSLRETVQDVAAILKPKADEKQIDFKVSIEDSLPEWIEGDPTRLKQVLLNLLGNAVKFTHKGEVSLRIQNKVHQLHFIIRDSGIGISPERLQKIFEGYTQAGAATTRLYGGTGLGLKISKQLVELMNGQLTAESQEDIGTTFSFTLPLKRGAPAVEQNASDLSLDIAKVKILIADDNEANLLLLENMLRQLMHQVDVAKATSGKEAVKLFTENNFDYVLMDLDMPDGNGFEAVTEIRKLNATVPVIANTANVMLSEEEAKAFGFSGLLLKPFSQKELIEKFHFLQKSL